MGLAAPPELGLGLKLPPPPPPPSPARRTVVRLLLEAAAAAGEGRKAKLQEFLHDLEEERRKIQCFPRELPLCMVIVCDGGSSSSSVPISGLYYISFPPSSSLHRPAGFDCLFRETVFSAIEDLEEELARCGGGGAAHPKLEEFIPINRKFEEAGRSKDEEDRREKANWMSSAQLWSDTSSTSNSGDSKNRSRQVGIRRTSSSFSRPRSDSETGFRGRPIRRDPRRKKTIGSRVYRRRVTRTGGRRRRCRGSRFSLSCRRRGCCCRRRSRRRGRPGGAGPRSSTGASSTPSTGSAASKVGRLFHDQGTWGLP